YFYVVTTTSPDGISVLSAEVPTTTHALPDPPGPVTATATSATQITVSWPVVTGAMKYTVYRGLNSGGPYTKVGMSTALQFKDKNLTPSTQYFYVVTVTTANGTSVDSGEASDVTNPLPDPPGNPTAAPGNLTATAVSSSQINLQWDTVPGATRYTVYRST